MSKGFFKFFVLMLILVFTVSAVVSCTDNDNTHPSDNDDSGTNDPNDSDNTDTENKDDSEDTDGSNDNNDSGDADDNENTDKEDTVITEEEKQAKLESAYSKLFSDINREALQENLVFVSSLDGVNIAYSSNKPNVISENGAVVMGETEQVVEITVTLSYEGKSLVKKECFTVSADILLVTANSLFADIDRENIIENVEFIRDFPNGVHAEYLTTDMRSMSYTGKVIRSRSDRSLTVHAMLSIDGRTLHRAYDFTVKAYTSEYDLIPRTEEDTTVYYLSMDYEDENLPYYSDWLYENFYQKYDPRRSVIIDFSKDAPYHAESVEYFIDLISRAYTDTIETLEMNGDEEGFIKNRRIKLIFPEYYKISFSYPTQSEDFTNAKVPNLNAILRQREILDSPYFRGSDYNDFPILKNNKGTKAVYTADQLQFALEEGYLPVFPAGAAKTEYYFECIKNILRDIITDDMNDVQKVTAIYEYLAQTCSYDHDAAYYSSQMNLGAFAADSFFEEGRLVCNGYSGIFSMLCNLEGIECREVGGGPLMPDRPDGHTWNNAKIDGVWYVFDSTPNQGIFSTLWCEDIYNQPHKSYERNAYNMTFREADHFDLLFEKDFEIPEGDAAAETNAIQMMFENYYIADGVDCYIASKEELNKYLDIVLSANVCGTNMATFIYEGIAEDDIKEALDVRGFKDYFLEPNSEDLGLGEWEYAFLMLRYTECVNPPLWGGGYADA